MNKKIRWSFLLLAVVFSMILFTGCTKKESVNGTKYKVYHINAEGTGLVNSPFYNEYKETSKMVDELLQQLQHSEDKIKERPAIPENVDLVRYTLNEEKLTLYFSKEYNEMDVVSEVLCRAAVVRTLTQIDGVDLIAFYVDDSPLVNKNGEPYGFFQAEDFVKNTGSSINSYEVKKLTLYFPNSTGDKLVRKDTNIRFNTNQSQERAVVERLMRGPEGDYVNAVIPKGTKVLGVSIKDGVCYINFDEGIKKANPGVKAETMVYAIVNSLTELGTVSRVQILINGESDILLQETMRLKEPLSRNLDIVEVK